MRVFVKYIIALPNASALSALHAAGACDEVIYNNGASDGDEVVGASGLAWSVRLVEPGQDAVAVAGFGPAISLAPRGPRAGRLGKDERDAENPPDLPWADAPDAQGMLRACACIRR